MHKIHFRQPTVNPLESNSLMQPELHISARWLKQIWKRILQNLGPRLWSNVDTSLDELYLFSFEKYITRYSYLCMSSLLVLKCKTAFLLQGRSLFLYQTYCLPLLHLFLLTSTLMPCLLGYLCLRELFSCVAGGGVFCFAGAAHQIPWITSDWRWGSNATPHHTQHQQFPAVLIQRHEAELHDSPKWHTLMKMMHQPYSLPDAGYLTHRERPVATEHSLCSSVDNLTSLPYVYATLRVETGQ